MKKLRTTAVLGLVLSAITIAAASAQSIINYAITTSGSDIYIIGSSNGIVKQLANDPSANFTGVAVHGNTIYAVDANNQQLWKGTISMAGSAHVNDWQKIALTNDSQKVVMPSAISIDSTGGVYVIGGSYNDGQGYSHYGYAYYSGGSTASIYDLSSSPMVDVAAYGTGSSALVLHQNSSDGAAGEAWVTRLIGGESGSATDMGTGNYFPQAITSLAGTNYVYTISRTYDNDMDSGSLVALNASTLNKIMDTKELVNGGTKMIPLAANTFTIGDSNYLAVIGSVGSSQAAWKILLGTDGVPQMTNITSFALADSFYSGQHYCTVSEDGSVMWISNPQTNTVVALSTSTWSQIGSFNMPGTSSWMASYAVPEPASLSALLAFCGGAFAMLRRRKK